MNILVRNLSKRVTEKDLMQLFLRFGRINSLNVVIDEVTGTSKGFGFVDMPEESEGAAAIKALNGKLIQGQKVRVKTTQQSFRPTGNKPDRARPERLEKRATRPSSKGKRSGTPGAKRRPSPR
jgi:RNA recognition motif-containing protein